MVGVSTTDSSARMRRLLIPSPSRYRWADRWSCLTILLWFSSSRTRSEKSILGTFLSSCLALLPWLAPLRPRLPSDSDAADPTLGTPSHSDPSAMREDRTDLSIPVDSFRWAKEMRRENSDAALDWADAGGACGGAGGGGGWRMYQAPGGVVPDGGGGISRRGRWSSHCCRLPGGGAPSTAVAAAAAVGNIPLCDSVGATPLHPDPAWPDPSRGGRRAEGFAGPHRLPSPSPPLRPPNWLPPFTERA